MSAKTILRLSVDLNRYDGKWCASFEGYTWVSKAATELDAVTGLYVRASEEFGPDWRDRFEVDGDAGLDPAPRPPLVREPAQPVGVRSADEVVVEPAGDQWGAVPDRR